MVNLIRSSGMVVHLYGALAGQFRYEPPLPKLGVYKNGVVQEIPHPHIFARLLCDLGQLSYIALRSFIMF